MQQIINFSNTEETQTKTKPITFFRNGDATRDKYLTIQCDNTVKIHDFRKLLRTKLGIKNDHYIRLFNQEGVEIYEEDLQFVKSNTVLFVSEGEEFDSNCIFAEYRKIKVIGQGGFGKVYLAENKITQEKVAIKFVNTNIIANAKDVDMVFREAEMLKSLNHPNIVKFYNCYTLQNQQVVFIMEFLEGGELLDYLSERGVLSENEAKIFFKQMVDAIHYCHKEKLIHRDLKLENVLLKDSRSKIIKIVDFGIAGISNNINIDKINVGSLLYMAPEVLTGKADKIGPNLDVWALGCILFGMVCGVLPFNGKNQAEIFTRICSGRVSIPPQIYDQMSEPLKLLINGILQVDPQIRLTLKEIQEHSWFQEDLQRNLKPNQTEKFKSSGRQSTRGINLRGGPTSFKNTGKQGLLGGTTQFRQGLAGGPTSLRQGLAGGPTSLRQGLQGGTTGVRQGLVGGTTNLKQTLGAGNSQISNLPKITSNATGQLEKNNSNQKEPLVKEETQRNKSILFGNSSAIPSYSIITHDVNLLAQKKESLLLPEILVSSHPETEPKSTQAKLPDPLHLANECGPTGEESEIQSLEKSKLGLTINKDMEKADDSFNQNDLSELGFGNAQIKIIPVPSDLNTSKTIDKKSRFPQIGSKSPNKQISNSPQRTLKPLPKIKLIPINDLEQYGIKLEVKNGVVYRKPVEERLKYISERNAQRVEVSKAVQFGFKLINNTDTKARSLSPKNLNKKNA